MNEIRNSMGQAIYSCVIFGVGILVGASAFSLGERFEVVPGVCVITQEAYDIVEGVNAVKQ